MSWDKILENAPAGSFDVDVDEDGKMFITEDPDFVGVEIHSSDEEDVPDEVYEPEHLGDR